jgi:hypothetical protein
MFVLGQIPHLIGIGGTVGFDLGAGGGGGGSKILPTGSGGYCQLSNASNLGFHSMYLGSLEFGGEFVKMIMRCNRMLRSGKIH